MPHVIRPGKYPLEVVVEDKDEQKPSIALLINKQIHEEVFYFISQHCHFLISINSWRVDCMTLESSILWALNQTEATSVKLASSIREIDIDLEWVKRQSFASPTAMNLRMVPLLKYVCEHLRAFQCLQTLTVRWNKDGSLRGKRRVQHAIFILGRLERLQADLPGVQITFQVTDQQRKSEIGDSPKDWEASVKLQDHMTELREHIKYPSVVQEDWSNC
ncbi:MAG: hypothetical protein ALECFALPRED_010773 [Alectoria fallacina]|uniref:Uncharacterized protein n=1 Tax=Alectoria fallacina TaxID=1903189 RepID=A0A8H3PKE3_9LECA|nr:MAG: hypothetical protein ALECFALPRED_010773 [Alectoria fallacina]